MSLLWYVYILFQSPVLAARFVFTIPLIRFVKWQRSLQRHLTTCRKHQYNIILTRTAYSLFLPLPARPSRWKGQTKSSENYHRLGSSLNQMTSSVTEPNGNNIVVLKQRQPKRHQLSINSDSVQMLNLTFNRINSDYVSQMRFQQKGGERAK